MGSNTSLRNTIIAAILFVVGLYRLGTPYMEETAQLREEADRLKLDIQQIQDEAASYGKGWAERMDKNEKLVKDSLPDHLPPSEVLNYFVSKFEAENPGKIAFMNVNTQDFTVFPLNPKGKENPRIARYKLNAELNPDRVVPYIEHVEKYPGLIWMPDFTFQMSGEMADALRMELNLIFFVSPGEWAAPPPKRILRDAQGKVMIAETSKEEKQKKEDVTWRPIFLSNMFRQALGQGTPEGAAPVRRPALVRRAGPLPKITKIVGEAIVIDENLYEEGDRIGGWLITKVNSQTKTVTFKSGSTIKTVVVK